MKPLRTRLQIERDRLGVPWETLERDYVLSWLLAGIAATRALSDALVFKGGTALKKCYFGDYRFSEDLDFSTRSLPLSSEVLDPALAEACGNAEAMLDEYAPVRLRLERQREREPHPGGQAAFVVRARLPWQGDHQTRIKVEITTDEPVLREPSVLPILHGYEESLSGSLSVYSLEEIVAEKLRAIRQHMRVMEERGWTRSRARDYYDLWRILTTYGDELDVRVSTRSSAPSARCETWGSRAWAASSRSRCSRSSARRGISGWVTSFRNSRPAIASSVTSSPYWRGCSGRARSRPSPCSAGRRRRR